LKDIKLRDQPIVDIIFEKAVDDSAPPASEDLGLKYIYEKAREIADLV